MPPSRRRPRRPLHAGVGLAAECEKRFPIERHMLLSPQSACIALQATMPMLPRNPTASWCMPCLRGTERLPQCVSMVSDTLHSKNVPGRALQADRHQHQTAPNVLPTAASQTHESCRSSCTEPCVWGRMQQCVFHGLRTGPRISETLSDCCVDQPHLAPADRVRRRPVRRLRRSSLQIPQVP